MTRLTRCTCSRWRGLFLDRVDGRCRSVRLLVLADGKSRSPRRSRAESRLSRGSFGILTIGINSQARLVCFVLV